MDILFLTNRPTENTQATTVTEYLNALHDYSIHKVHEISMLHHFPNKIDLNRFDVVITHYSLSLGPLLYHYLGHDLVEKLKRYRGLKAAFLQDEYREIQTYWKHINELGINLLFSCVPNEEIPKVYPFKKVPNLRVVNVLTGYVPKGLIERPVLPVAHRPIDIGYRTRRMPFWLGRLGHEKWLIAEEFRIRAKNSGLKLDLSSREGERLYGDAWTNFVASCRVMIGVESGASIIDFDGMLEYKVEDYVAKNPNATFEDVYEKFLTQYEGSLKLHQISPRCFEAAALRTPMVLFEGEYSGVLEPDRHFLVLKKNFSNFEDIILKLRDHSLLQAMADRTYHEVALQPKWSYQSFVQNVDSVLEKEIESRVIPRAVTTYSKNEFDQAVKSSFNYYFRRKIVLFMQSVLLGVPFLRMSLFWLWEKLPRQIKQSVRPLARFVSR
jgi:hypothetical protein